MISTGLTSILSHSLPEGGSFILKGSGKNPIFSINDFSFHFKFGDLAVMYAKEQGKFNISYSFITPITRPSDSAHDLLSADRFINEFVLSMIKSFDALLSSSDSTFEDEHLRGIVDDYMLSNVQIIYTRGGSESNYVVVSGNF